VVDFPEEIDSKSFFLIFVSSWFIYVHPETLILPVAPEIGYLL